MSVLDESNRQLVEADPVAPDKQYRSERFQGASGLGRGGPEGRVELEAEASKVHGDRGRIEGKGKAQLRRPGRGQNGQRPAAKLPVVAGARPLDPATVPMDLGGLGLEYFAAFGPSAAEAAHSLETLASVLLARGPMRA